MLLFDFQVVDFNFPGSTGMPNVERAELTRRVFHLLHASALAWCSNFWPLQIPYQLLGPAVL